MSVRHTPRQLDYEAILRPSRWASGIQVIGAIPEYVVQNLGLTTSSRSVWLHEQTVASICDSRGLRTEDSEFVFEYMPAAVFRPMFFGVEERTGSVRISLVELIRGEGRYLYIGVKLTRSRSGDDELWVSTGYPISDETLRRYLRSGRLKGVVGRRLDAERRAPPGEFPVNSRHRCREKRARPGILRDQPSVAFAPEGCLHLRANVPLSARRCRRGREGGTGDDRSRTARSDVERVDHASHRVQARCPPGNFVADRPKLDLPK